MKRKFKQLYRLEMKECYSRTQSRAIKKKVSYYQIDTKDSQFHNTKGHKKNLIRGTIERSTLDKLMWHASDVRG